MDLIHICVSASIYTDIIFCWSHKCLNPSTAFVHFPFSGKKKKKEKGGSLLQYKEKCSNTKRSN